MRIVCAFVLELALLHGAPAGAQSAPRPIPTAPAGQQAAAPTTPDPKIHRLILKDGSYQVVTTWQIIHGQGGDRIRYISAERGGDPEEVPMELIDWAATRAFAAQHSNDGPANQAQDEAAALDAEEKSDRNRNLEVSPGLRLPEETGIWALDYFHDQPELVELVQATGDVNQQTGHNISRSPINPQGSTRQTLEMNERHAKVALHEPQPAFYISVDAPDGDEPSASAITVDTHGAAAVKGPESASSPNSRYVILHADVRKEYRFVGEVNVSPATTDRNVFAANLQLLEGKRWFKLTPKEPLAAGDYVLMEILSPREANMAVWDFRIDPNAPENEHAMYPVERYRIQH